MLKIGITGGIGSGKTYVCKVLEKLGYPVFYSDVEAKKLMLNNENVKYNIQNLLGTEAYIFHELNKEYIAEKIFKNQELRTELNKIVHPVVFQEFEKWSKNQTNKIVFNESALLFETGSYKRFDKNILITAPEKIRINRIKKRDKIDEDEISRRINSQLNEEEKWKLSDLIIINDDSHLIIPQLITMISEFSDL